MCTVAAICPGFDELHFSDEGWAYLIGPGQAPRWVQPLLGHPLVEDSGKLFLSPEGLPLEPIALDQVKVTVSYFVRMRL